MTVERTWRDPKRHLWLIGLVVPLLPFIAGLQVWATGWNALWWMGPLWILVLMPLLDTVFGTDPSNPPEWAVPALDADRFYRWCTYLYLPIQYLGFAWAAAVVVRGDLSPVSQLGLALTVGTVAGVGINTAHELGHKRDRLERRLSKVALAQSAYGHFYVEHNRGHHARVSTPEDPASARLGESFWRFLPRTVVGSLRSAWHLAAGAQARKGQRTWSLRNDVLNAWALSAILFGTTVAVLGPAVIPFLVVQAASGPRCSRSSTTSSTTGCCARGSPTAATSAASPPTAGTATTWSPTLRSTTWSGTPTTMPTPRGATRRCGTSTRPPSCPPATR